MRRTLDRSFWPIVAAIALLAGWLEVKSAMDETQTWDEGIHISAGYSYLTLGDYSWNIEHPPLVKIMSALPLTLMGLKAEPIGADGKRKDQVQYGVDFLYANRRHADTILIAARSANILLTLLFLVAIAWWTRRRWGPAAGLCAAALCAFDPNLIAHGRYVTTDFPLTVFFFFACVLWAEYLESGGRLRLLAAAAAIAIAMVVKFSAILLIPPLVLIYAACWIRRPREFSVLRAARDLAVVAGVLTVAVVVVYWPETMRCIRTRVTPLADSVNQENFIGLTLAWLGRTFHLPAHAFLRGLADVAQHNAGGHESYLLGMRSKTGFWYYFPVVFAVKSTMAALAATLLVFAACPWVLVRRGLEAVTPMSLALVLPPILYFAVSMSSGINLGMRHILPIYPFLYVGAAAIFATQPKFGIALVAALAVLQAGECASIHPDYLAFFNAPSGGPGRGPEYLVDSNIDWGQDVKKLVHWLDAHGTRRVRVFYFGNAQLRYHGVDEVGYPGPMDQKAWDEIDDYCVANVTPLEGIYVPLDSLAPLRMREPIAKVGWSMYVYDLRKTKK
jgi:hypothetical protein